MNQYWQQSPSIRRIGLTLSQSLVVETPSSCWQWHTECRTWHRENRLEESDDCDMYTFGVERKEAAQLSLSGRKLRCVGIEQVACFGIEDNGSAACQRQLGSQVFRNQKLTLAI